MRDNDDNLLRSSGNHDPQPSSREENGKRSSSDVTRFEEACVATARKNASQGVAERYCECMLKKAQRDFDSYNGADRNTKKSWVDKNAPGCNQRATEY